MRRAITWQLVVGLLVVVGWLVLGVAAPLLTKTDPLKTTTLLMDGSRAVIAPYEPGTYGFPLGSDRSGRDLWTGVMYGARATLTIAFIVLAARFAIGTALGALAGWFAGSTLDLVLMRITDVMYAFPTVLFAIVILAAIGQNLINIYLALGLTFWPPMARLVRSQVLSLREKEYVEAARAIGVPSWRIMFLQILPNALGPIIVAITFGIPFAILIEAFLSFIGIGTPPPIPSWGGMIVDAKPQLRSEPWLVLFPSAALAITLFAFNFFGDGLRDALDPRSRR